MKKENLKNSIQKKEKMYTAIDLFCGAGGCSEGLLQAGFSILFSSDISPMVEKTYCNRHQQLGLIQGKNTYFQRADIKDLKGKEILLKISKLDILKKTKVPEIDLIIGGPSCQGFSRAGRRDKNDPRNKLFREYVRIIGEINPKYIVLENVEGFIDMQFDGFVGLDGEIYDNGMKTPVILRKELKKIGYLTLEPKVLNAADFGVPQRRNRVVFIGYRKGLKAPEYPKAKYTKDKYINLKDAISDLIVNDSVKKQVCNKKSKYQKESYIGRTPDVKGNPIKASLPLTCVELPKISDVVKERFSLFKQGETGSELRKRVKKNGVNLLKKPSLLSMCEKILKLKKDQIIKLYKKTNIEDKYLDILLTKKNMRQRWDEKKLASTVMTIADDYINPWENRTFSVREMARCQSFDDSFEFLGKRTTGGLLRRTEVPQYSQVGNAVPPLLAKAIVEEIKKVLEK